MQDLYTENYKTLLKDIKEDINRDFPGGPVVKNPPSNAGDAGSIPGQMQGMWVRSHMPQGN